MSSTADATDPHKKRWNEDLVEGLRARHQQAWQQQRATQHQWRVGADAIEAIRKDIRITKTGKIFNLDPKKLAEGVGKTVYEECVKIIKGESPILPPGFTPLTPQQVQHVQENTVMPYIQKLPKQSGGYAILLAFHICGRDSLCKQEICRAGQPYCSSEMESNYHAGRMFGAWKAKDTLVKNGLITEHKTGATWTPTRGFRSNGKHTFSISPEGKRAIQQIFQKWPDVKEQLGAGGGGGGAGASSRTGGGGGGWTTTTTTTDSSGDGPFGLAATATATTPLLPKKKSPKSTQDEQDLLEWIKSATCGQQKVFKGAGKDRRFYLHRLCDHLQTTCPGLQLEHESEFSNSNNGAAGGNRRDLYITLRSKPSSGSSTSNLGGSSSSGVSGLDSTTTTTPTTTTTTTASTSKKRRQSAATTAISGNGQKLGGSAAKKPRSASKAAASAALARQQQQQHQHQNTPPTLTTSTPIVTLSASKRSNNAIIKQEDHQFVNNVTPNRSHPIVELLDDDDDDSEEDKKPAAKPTKTTTTKSSSATTAPKPSTTPILSLSPSSAAAARAISRRPHNPYDYQIDDRCILKSTGETCLIYRVHCSGHVSIILPTGEERQMVPVREIMPTPDSIAIHNKAYKEKEEIAARKKAAATKSSSSSRSSRRSMPQPKFIPSTAKSAAAAASVLPRRKSDHDVQVFDLCDDDDEEEEEVEAKNVNNKLESKPTSPPAPATATAATPIRAAATALAEATISSPTTTDRSNNKGKLIIYIDDRERSRNHKPRELRIDLTRELHSGTFKNFWSEEEEEEEAPSLSPVTVEERKLHYGDFAFVERHDTDEGQRSRNNNNRLSVVVERKRVADLVQRSAYGDHWKQLSRMRDCCEYAILLIENDTKFATRFDAYGSQSLLEPRLPGQHTIESGADIFLFMGRAILSSSRIKFVQTKDSRGTFRSVGAIGIMAHTNPQIGRRAPVNPLRSATAQSKLSDRLTKGGIHWKIAKEIAFQFGSIEAMEVAFNACTSNKAKESLLQPILQNMGDERINRLGDPVYWSKAISLVFFARSDEVRTTKRQSFQDLQAFVGKDVYDPALLLCCIYNEDDKDSALIAAIDSPTTTIPSTTKRRVAIVISKAFGPCFEMPIESSFYTLSENDGSRSVSQCLLPSCHFSTSCGNLYSNKMTIFLMEGSQVVEEAIQSMNKCGSNNGSLVEAARALAMKWNNLCRLGDDRGDRSSGPRVLLVRGFGPAIDMAAKQASYREETPVFCEMAFASLMMQQQHNDDDDDDSMVVLQAVRKKQEETTIMMRQLALSCYHYQLLHHEREEE